MAAPKIETTCRWVQSDRFVYLEMPNGEFVTKIGCQNPRWAAEICRELNLAMEYQKAHSTPGTPYVPTILPEDWKERALRKKG